jgi:hypothetical protein
MYQISNEKGVPRIIQMTNDHKPSNGQENDRIHNRGSTTPTAKYFRSSFKISAVEANSILFRNQSPASGPLESKQIAIRQKTNPNDNNFEDILNQKVDLDERNKTFIQRRGKNGPLAVFSKQGTISLTMTRSIGDRSGPVSCIAVPDVTKITIPPKQHARFILASDGVWDVMDHTDIQRDILRIKDPKVASNRIAMMAWRKRIGRNMRMDDITVIIVDIFPKSFQPYHKRCMNSCLVS